MSHPSTGILVTGASGFVGRSLVRYLAGQAINVVAVSRGPIAASSGITNIQVDRYEDLAEMPDALAGASAIVHLADRSDRRSYSAVTEGRAAALVEMLTHSAARFGVRRFVLASSIYAEAPERSHYGRSKALAEAALLAAPAEIALCAVLRLPPVLGPDGGGAMGLIARSAKAGRWLPLGRTNAPRRFIGVGNLATLVAAICQSDAPFRGILAPNEGVPLSLRQLAEQIGSMHGRRVRFLPLPFVDRLSPLTLADRETTSEALAFILAEFGWSPALSPCE